MSGIKAAFGFGHSFWKEAIDMRQRDNSIAEIVKRGNELGYDLSYKQIAYGLTQAPADLHLPARSALWLRKKYEKVTERFNSYESMRDLAQEAINKAGECEEELKDETLTLARKMVLEQSRDRWLNRAFDWSERCTRVAIQIEGLGNKPITPDSRPEDVDSEFRVLMGEFKDLVPSPPQSTLAQMFGGDNFKSPSEDDDESED